MTGFIAASPHYYYVPRKWWRGNRIDQRNGHVPRVGPPRCSRSGPSAIRGGPTRKPQLKRTTEAQRHGDTEYQRNTNEKASKKDSFAGGCLRRIKLRPLSLSVLLCLGGSTRGFRIKELGVDPVQPTSVVSRQSMGCLPRKQQMPCRCLHLFMGGGLDRQVGSANSGDVRIDLDFTVCGHERQALLARGGDEHAIRRVTVNRGWQTIGFGHDLRGDGQAGPRRLV